MMRELSLQQADQVSGGIACDIEDGACGDLQNTTANKGCDTGYDEGYNDALFDVALGFFVAYLPIII